MDKDIMEEELDKLSCGLPPNKPEPSLCRYIKEGDSRKKCPVCGSSQHRKFFGFRADGCLNPKCTNYYNGIKDE